MAPSVKSCFNSTRSSQADDVRASFLISVSTSEPAEHLFGVPKRDGGSASNSLDGVDVVSQLGGVPLVSVALSTSTAYAGASAHDTSVDAARDAVLLLDVDLGQGEGLLGVGGVLLDISPGGTVDHLSHLETLDSLVLGHATGTVDAPDHVRMSLVVLPSSVVSSL
jgi:hypothetical protein